MIKLRRLRANGVFFRKSIFYWIKGIAILELLDNQCIKPIVCFAYILYTVLP